MPWHSTRELTHTQRERERERERQREKWQMKPILMFKPGRLQFEHPHFQNPHFQNLHFEPYILHFPKTMTVMPHYWQFRGVGSPNVLPKLGCGQ